MRVNIWVLYGDQSYKQVCIWKLCSIGWLSGFSACELPRELVSTLANWEYKIGVKRCVFPWSPEHSYWWQVRHIQSKAVSQLWKILHIARLLFKNGVRKAPLFLLKNIFRTCFWICSFISLISPQSFVFNSRILKILVDYIKTHMHARTALSSPFIYLCASLSDAFKIEW